MYLEQQPQLPSTSTEANNMNNILTTEIQNNSASLFFEILIDSRASARNLYFGGQQNEQLLNMAEPEWGMNS